MYHRIILVSVDQNKIRIVGIQYVCIDDYDRSIVLVGRKTSHGKSNYSTTGNHVTLDLKKWRILVKAPRLRSDFL